MATEGTSAPSGADRGADVRLNDRSGGDFRAPIEAIPDPVFVLGTVRDAAGAVVDLEYRFVNAAALRLNGMRRDEVVGHRQSQLFPSVRDSEIWDSYVAVIESGAPASIDVPQFDENGVRGSFALSVAPFEGGLIVTARDVTDRVRAEGQLRSDRDFINATLDVAGALILVVDAEGCIVRFNRQMELLSGYREAEVLGRPYLMLLPPDERAQVAPDTVDTPAPDQSHGRENHLLTKDGELRLIRWSNAAVVDSDGRLKHGIGVGVDITEQRQAEDELRRERDFINATLNVAGAAIVVADADGYIVRFNRQAERLTGYREADVVGHHYEFLFPPDERDQVAMILEQFSDGEPVGKVNHYVTKSGELRLVRWSYAVLADAAGRRTHLIGVGIDITDQQRAEDELARRAAECEVANRELGRSNADLEQFAYIASHDLREPLRAISGPIARVAERYKGQLDEEADALIGFAVEGCARMQSRIDGLLAFSLVGRTERALVPTDSDRVAREAIDALGPTLQRNGAEVVLGRLPIVLAVPDQLSQVFQNLISNAAKFVAPGVRPRISISAEPVATGWRFDVIDNGIGLLPEDRERAFVMFKRLPTEHKYPGTGIGLAVVKKIVERLGGEIGVDDAPAGGGGSWFWFTMPALPPLDPT